MKRQTCCRCFKATTDYRTDEIDRRTPAEVAAGREPVLRRFHTCRDCAGDPDGEDIGGVWLGDPAIERTSLDMTAEEREEQFGSDAELRAGTQ